MWKIGLMFYTPRVHRAIVDASPCNFLGFSSKFALCFCLQPQLLHSSKDGRMMICGAEYLTLEVASPFLP